MTTLHLTKRGNRRDKKFHLEGIGKSSFKKELSIVDQDKRKLRVGG